VAGDRLTRYILRRLLQALPLLFILSVVLFVLMQNIGDPLATMGGAPLPAPRIANACRASLGWTNPSPSSTFTGW